MYESDEKESTGAPKLKSKEKKKLDPKFLEDMSKGIIDTDAPDKEQNMTSAIREGDQAAKEAGVDPDLARESAKAKIEEAEGKSLDESDPSVQKKIAAQMQKDAEAGSSTMTAEQKDELVAKSKEDDSGANMPTERSDVPTGEQEEKPQEEPPEQESGWGDSLKNALKFFGPRMGALLIGGPGALELTEGWLNKIDDQQMDALSQRKFEREEEKLQLSKDRLALQQAESKRKGAQFDMSHSLRLAKSQEPPQKFLESIAAKETVMNHSKSISELLDKVNPDRLGPVAGRLTSGAVAAGILKDKDFVQLKQSTGKMLVDYVKSVSGAQVSDKEAERLSGIIFSVNDNIDVFRAKLENFDDMLKEEFEVLAKVYKSGQPLTAKGVDRIVGDLGKRLDMRISNKKEKNKEKAASTEQPSASNDIMNKYGLK